jgi:hypothetical protein
MREPTRHREHPTMPIFPNRSPRKIAASTAPTRTESAPSGVTSTGGANVYAAKFATAKGNSKQSKRGERRKEREEYLLRQPLQSENASQLSFTLFSEGKGRTGDHARPPQPVLEVRMRITRETLRLIRRRDETLCARPAVSFRRPLKRGREGKGGSPSW